MKEHAIADDDNLTCPITLEILNDPVRATDGRVYEREAITRWIELHGTSPFTRQPLRIEDLKADHILKQHAVSYRNSTVSYQAKASRVKLPPIPLQTTGNRTNRYLVRSEQSNQQNQESTQCSRNVTFCSCFILSGIIVLMIVIVLVLTVFRKSDSNSQKIPSPGTECGEPAPGNTVLLERYNVHTFFYKSYKVAYYANVSTRYTLKFRFRTGFFPWLLDDISIIDLSTGLELIENSGFETGTTGGYSLYAEPGNIFSYIRSKVSFSQFSHSGTYVFEGRGDLNAEILSQTVSMVAGHRYCIGFCLEDPVFFTNSFIASIIPSV